MVKISVVTPASRDFISLDIPFLSLLSQDFDDYEWINVDKKYHERGNLIRGFNQALGNRIVHIPEEERSGEYFWGLCHAMNTALLYDNPNFWVNPTHVRPFTERAFDFICNKEDNIDVKSFRLRNKSVFGSVNRVLVVDLEVVK